VLKTNDTFLERDFGTDRRRDEPQFRILEPGRNCLGVATARRASVLVDAADYFVHLEASLRRASRSIVILGWDFDAGICLRREGHGKEPLTLGDLLRSLVEEHPELEIRILIWSLSTIHAPGATGPLLFGSPWQDHPRITLRLDNHNPIYGAHHQKIVLVDDGVAFVGGIDLTVDRWDTIEHAPDDERRVTPDGCAYGAVHDVQMAVDGEAAKEVRKVADSRWRAATAETLPVAGASSDVWPPDLEPDFRDVPVAVARTVPRRGIKRGIREIEHLNIAALRVAKHSIYIETQYLADRRIGDLLAKSLAQEEGPEIVVLVPREGHGFLERWIMDGNRDRVVRRMKRGDRFGRLRACYPVVALPDGDCPIFIHAKVLIVDDKFLRIGSSNFNRRSTGLDTECDLAIEAQDAETEQSIAGIRARLLGEHLGVEPGVFAAAVVEQGSLVGAIDRLGSGRRRLRPYTHISRRGPTLLKFGTRLLDPRGTIRLASLFARRGSGA
jgi:phosphatidylserine/phosphatidylglycerophosphate/cardiolipin synthase-like enzyme